MNKLLITNIQGTRLTALVSEKRVLEIQIEDQTSLLGNIYVGKVKQVVKNLNAAFVDFLPNQTGYLSLTDNKHILYGNTIPGKSLRPGDEILVQVAKDAMKTKDPVLTTNLNFSGNYSVITTDKPIVGFSTKLVDKAWKQMIKPQIEAITENQFGTIVRTNAYGQPVENLLDEVQKLKEKCEKLVSDAKFRTCYTKLYEAEPDYLKLFANAHPQSLEEVLTDDEEVYHLLEERIKSVPVRFYSDDMITLSKLYSLEIAMNQAFQKKVWLKSGGYLIIEQTEAMVVVDVNTGKYSGKKTLEEAILKINLEAAQELCYQLRLRNLSGIIIVDFIDMKIDEHKSLLLHQLRDYAKRDSIKTTVLDMTALNLVEMTRKKGRKPLVDQLGAFTSS